MFASMFAKARLFFQIDGFQRVSSDEHIALRLEAIAIGFHCY